MAVEASPITLLPPPNREMSFQGSGRHEDRLQTKYELPVYGFGKTDSFPTPDFKAVSGVITSSTLPLSRKRSRDSPSFNPPFSISKAPNDVPDGHKFGEFTFLGDDISSQICQQQLEIDRLIAYHGEKVRAEIEETQTQNSRRLIAAVHQAIMKRLKSKEDEIIKIGQLNLSLEEKVKSLITENQIWKELVQTHEATAIALRNKLDQVLAQIQLQQQQQKHLDFANNSAKPAVLLVDDAQSYCGSNYEEDHRQVAGYGGGERITRSGGWWWCRKCGKEESSVLVLPCRHLCVCTLCVSSIKFCPICTSAKSAGVHVNITSF